MDETQDLRVKCLALLNTIPEDGLAELLETMVEIRDFYQERAVHQTIPLPALRIEKVRIGETRIRPQFFIEEDE